jgi:SAM-dependent methyltransferase
MSSAKAMTAGVPHDYDAIWRNAYGHMQDMGPVHRHMRRLCRQMLTGIDYGSVLDVGCGAGHNIELLRDGRAVELAGVDISEEALSRARGMWPQGDFSELDIQADHLDRQWDLVFSSLVLEHLPDDERALRNMRAMSRRYLLVTTIAGDFERNRAWEEQMGHVRNYAHGELERKLERAGFIPERIAYWGFPFYTPIGRRLQRGMTSEAEFGPAKRLMARLMYGLYFLNGRKRGDLLVALARVDGASASA